MRKSMQTTTRPNVWVAGLTPDLFEVDEQPSVVVPTSEAAAAVTVDMAANAVAAPADKPATLDEDGGFAGFLASLQAPVEEAPGKSWIRSNPDQWRPTGGELTRIESNIAAIERVQAIAASGAAPDPDDEAVLLRYTGWGSLPRLFVPDGSAPSPLAAQRERVRALVGDVAMDALRASTTSAFFTPPEITTAMWEIVRRAGFRGGRVLEPAAGPGHMLATMPAELATASEITAVEMDPTSAMLLRAAFAPYGVQVHESPLEAVRLTEGYFDLVIANPPYGDFPARDNRNRPYSRWSIHNWFLAKSLELVRPGGLVVMVTSRHTLDAKRSEHRKWLAT